MCELFGLSANIPVNISFSWHGFKKRGKHNPDGWGVAWYNWDKDNEFRHTVSECRGEWIIIRSEYIGPPKGRPKVYLVKEPEPTHTSPIAKFLTNNIRGHIIISHVRLASQGERIYVNTHPFVRKLGNFEWIFAHNGDVSGIMQDPTFELKIFKPIGDTDSEYAFCYILEKLSKLSKDSLENVLILAQEIRRLATEIGKFGKFNFLLSNGIFLFAYMNRKKTLHYLLRHPPHKGYATLIDEDFKVNLQEIKSPNEAVALIATRPLTNENWTSFKPSELIVFHSGDLVLRITPNGEIKHNLSKKEIEVLCVIRQSPHAISIAKISEKTNMTPEETAKIIKQLLTKGYIRKNRNPPYPIEHPESKYYTNKHIRNIIDELILKNT